MWPTLVVKTFKTQTIFDLTLLYWIENDGFFLHLHNFLNDTNVLVKIINMDMKKFERKDIGVFWCS